MKVFFAASPRGNTQYGHTYLKIVEQLKSMSCSLVDDEVIKISLKEFEQMMKQGQTAYIKRYRQKMEAIQTADICLFEVSVHSIGLGYAIQKAVEAGKPTIVLYRQESAPYFLFGAENERLILKSYDGKNIKKVLNEVIEKAKERKDKRFNFFISPKLVDYLEIMSKKQGLTKSKLIRDLILENMRKSENQFT